VIYLQTWNRAGVKSSSTDVDGGVLDRLVERERERERERDSERDNNWSGSMTVH